MNEQDSINRESIGSPNICAETGGGRQFKVLTTCIVILTALAVIAALYLGRTVLLPFTLAWMSSLLLSPIVRWTSQKGIPNPISAGVLVLIAVFMIFLAGRLLAEPASDWIERWPQKTAEVREKLNIVQKPLLDLRKAGDEVAKLGKSEDQSHVTVSVEKESWLKSVVTDDIPTLSSQALIIIVLTFFLLSSRGSIARHIGQFGRDFQGRRHLMSIATQIRRQISTYLNTIALVNLAQAIITSFVLWVLNFPNPLLWGCLAGLLNFAPYVGPLITVCLLTIVGLVSYETLWAGLLAPAAFMVITTFEGHLITPSIVGQRLKLSPISVFMAVVFWTWIWGVGGALMAAPILACLKIFHENLFPVPLKEQMGKGSQKVLAIIVGRAY
ncbi:AI-2E family transporter [Microbulbifer sp. THAF38]|uniref:AI-2E family transporter n=1 Tax=Microbulbifer sp. THAF38 TaxID=2587856 RepID=UPI00126983C8|nr:AI-2E family transporter [Microbulbifer sp. THAF38]QFT55994.1 AI-2 transport protein TqsA [Microbulbifer sp. THAF38]